MTPNPAVSFVHDGPTQWFDPVQLTPGALLNMSRSSSARKSVIDTLRQLTADDYAQYLSGYLERGDRVFGEEWDYTDLLLTLKTATRLIRPAAYLEIGVRRGRSLAVVVNETPDVAAWGLDLWIPHYAGLENPGPDFVRDEMRRLGHRGPLTLLSGDSRQTLPALLSEQPDLWFDLVTVDGDHTIDGAAHDLLTIMPRVRPGGVILFDDIAHPLHLDLADCWRDTVGAHPGFSTASYTDLGYGIAVGVRKVGG